MKKLALWGILLVMGVGAWRAITSDAPEGKLLFDRLWVDHQPGDPAETFEAVVVNGEHPFGHFATRTTWKGQWEGFHYHVIPREDGVMDFLFGATKERQRVRYTARTCSENGFDLCLELSGTSRGVRHYYSKKDWRFGAGALDRAGDLVGAAMNSRR